MSHQPDAPFGCQVIAFPSGNRLPQKNKKPARKQNPGRPAPDPVSESLAISQLSRVIYNLDNQVKALTAQKSELLTRLHPAPKK